MRVLELTKNPLRLAIWFEVYSNPDVTIEEITENLNLKGMDLSNQVEQMEKERLITSSTYLDQDTKQVRKMYTMDPSFFDIEEGKLRKQISDSSRMSKDRVLASLSYQMMMTADLIIRYSKLDNQQIEEKLENRETYFSKLVYINRRDLPKVFEKIAELTQYINTIRKDEGRKPIENISKASDIVVLGVFVITQTKLSFI